VRAQVPANALLPLVVPKTVLPAAGSTTGAPHVPAGSVVLVVLVGVVVEVTPTVDVVVVLMVVVVVVRTVELVVDDVDGRVVEVVELVEVAAGGVTVRAKLPWDVAYPSTTMKYVCPATTAGVRMEPRCGFVRSVVVPQPTVSSLQATCVPVAHTPWRR
jgi:hypothetical protein